MTTTLEIRRVHGHALRTVRERPRAGARDPTSASGGLATARTRAASSRSRVRELRARDKAAARKRAANPAQSRATPKSVKRPEMPRAKSSWRVQPAAGARARSAPRTASEPGGPRHALGACVSTTNESKWRARAETCARSAIQEASADPFAPLTEDAFESVVADFAQPQPSGDFTRALASDGVRCAGLPADRSLSGAQQHGRRLAAASSPLERDAQQRIGTDSIASVAHETRAAASGGHTKKSARRMASHLVPKRDRSARMEDFPKLRRLPVHRDSNDVLFSPLRAMRR